MKQTLAKITLITLCLLSITSCSVIKRLNKDDYLLTKNTLTVDDKTVKTEATQSLIRQKPNRKLLFGIPLRLHIYNLARPNRDSLFEAWLDRKPKRRERLKAIYSQKQVDKLKESALGFNNWLRKTGEAPTIVDSSKTKKTALKLKKYYFNNGWFDVTSTYKINTQPKQRATIDYTIKKGKPYILDSIKYYIKSPIIDTLFQLSKGKTLIKSGEQYKDANLKNERARITNNLRNSGLYHFSQEYVKFYIDTVNATKKVNIDYEIENRLKRKQDSIYREPFKIYKIRDVNIITDYSYKNRNKYFKDSTKHDGFNLYSYDKLKYKPKALTEAIFIKKDSVFRDIDRTRTYRYLSELQTFKYPDIEYIENEEDSTLTALILLSPRKKYTLGFDFDISQSNIQQLGLSFKTGLTIRNVFRRAEKLEISAIGAIGASKDVSDSKDQFFDINELGADIKLTIPRLFSPFNTDKIIPKYMSPITRISLSATSQKNIGLDKQTINGAFNYKWNPKTGITNQIDVFNIQFIKNVNSANYFNVYSTSYNSLNNIAINSGYTTTDLTIPEGANSFISDVLLGNTSLTNESPDFQSVLSIAERRFRITQDNLIFASNFVYTKNTRENLYDDSFSKLNTKVEFAGNLFSLLAKPLNFNKNENGQYQILGVPFSQYLKTEVDYIKHWDLSPNTNDVIATRAFAGIAIPYGNSENIPFSKSYYGGGANDNRAWQAYKLGPGRSESFLDFNEANFKLAFNAEYRFDIAGRFKGALFTDIGNIWNVFDNIGTDETKFKGFSSLKDLAIGSGVGLRYDLSFFAVRFDVGFKTYEPALPEDSRWFKNFNFNNAVYNIGINYPF